MLTPEGGKEKVSLAFPEFPNSLPSAHLIPEPPPWLGFLFSVKSVREEVFSHAGDLEFLASSFPNGRCNQLSQNFAEVKVKNLACLEGKVNSLLTL